MPPDATEHQILWITIVGTVVQVCVIPLLGIIWWMLCGRISELREWLKGLQQSKESEHSKFVRLEDCHREHDRLADAMKGMSEHIADLVYRKLEVGLRREVDGLSERVRRLESRKRGDV